jgi:hypothetical protein
MQLFSRRVLLAGPPAEIMAYAAGMRAFVSEKTGREVALWSAGFGAPLGTMLYTARVEGLADLAAMTAGLLSDPEYQARLEEGRGFTAAPAEDSLAQPIHGELGDPPPVGAVATVTSAVIKGGAFQEAIAWGVDMAQHGESVTGVPTLFTMNSYGPFGTVNWVGVAADPAAADAASAALNGDADYVAKLGALGDLFVDGSGHQVQATRVA